jgi:hypothetical protein
VTEVGERTRLRSCHLELRQEGLGLGRPLRKVMFTLQQWKLGETDSGGGLRLPLGSELVPLALLPSGAV